MGAFVKGDVVVVPFPFSDLSESKRRPALVVGNLSGDDVILCQITSQATNDRYAIPLEDQDFAKGTLQRPSNIRPNRLFTADSNIVRYKAGNLTREKIEEATEAIIDILRA
ncbi:MAG TPA: type II toxin-antitoxin system PemK/MazF family toxin [Chloroflexia bacterium]|nr:type II toxin-antitoxin system PemK/MazF family toxin [Chloroflexia bacterium]